MSFDVKLKNVESKAQKNGEIHLSRLRKNNRAR